MVTKDDEQRIRLRDDVDFSLMCWMHEKSAIISGIPGVVQTKTGVVNEIVMNYLAMPVAVQIEIKEAWHGDLFGQMLSLKPGDVVMVAYAGTGHYPPKGERVIEA